MIPAVTMHAAINVGNVLVGSGGALDGALPIGLVVGSGVWWLITVVLVGLYGPTMTRGSTIEPLRSRGSVQ